LRERARKAIENEPSGAAQASAAFAHHLPNRDIGHERATAHEFRGSLHRGAQFTFTFGGRTKHVAGRKMAGVQVASQQVGLRSFADTRRPEKNEPRRILYDFGLFALRRRPLQPSRMIVIFLCRHSARKCTQSRNTAP
jgi:hypothetical protein